MFTEYGIYMTPSFTCFEPPRPPCHLEPGCQNRSLCHQVISPANNPRFEQIRMADTISKLGIQREHLKHDWKQENAIEF